MSCTVETYKDREGDTLEATFYDDGDLILQVDRANASAQDPVGTVLLQRRQVLALFHRLGDHLMATSDAENEETTGLPDLTADGYSWDPGVVPVGTPLTVTEEAQQAVYGPREADYGHPREDFTRQAMLWTGLLNHKLAEGEFIEAEDIARCMVAVKLARDVHSPKRDNRVDGAGYFLTLDRLATGK